MTYNSEEVESIIENFIKDFVLKDKQDRISNFLANKKNWWKIRIEFHTSVHFDNKKLIEIKPNEQYANQIYLKMKELGATEDCVSLLDYLKNENCNYKLEQKLSDTVGFLIETVLFCPKTKVGYFEGGHAKDRYILKF